MHNVDTLIHAGWVIPVSAAPHKDPVTLQKHSIAITQGLIEAIVPTAEASRFSAAETVDLSHHAVIPGLINAHTHSAMSLFRGLADDLPLMEWLTQHIWPAEQHWVSDEFVRDGTELSIAEMIRSGTTCFCDMYFFPEDTAAIARKAHIRAAIGMIMIDFPSAYAADSEEYLRKGLHLHDNLRNDPLLTTVFAPHAPYTVSDNALKKIVTLAEELDVPVTMHVHETEHEVREAEEKDGKRPLARLAGLDLLGPRLAAVHMTALTEQELGIIAEAGVQVIHCPESNLKLASGFCPVNQLIRNGVNVALGTDGAASNNDLDMLSEMRTAALLAKGVAQDATALPAYQALQMATINGARALGLEQITGSLDVGKAADITAIDLSAIATTPVYDPVSHIVYSAQRDQVTHVWVQGKCLLKDRILMTLDEEAITARANHWRDMISKENGLSVN